MRVAFRSQLPDWRKGGKHSGPLNYPMAHAWTNRQDSDLSLRSSHPKKVLKNQPKPLFDHRDTPTKDTRKQTRSTSTMETNRLSVVDRACAPWQFSANVRVRPWRALAPSFDLCLSKTTTECFENSRETQSKTKGYIDRIQK